MKVFYLLCNKQKKTWNIETDDSISLSTLFYMSITRMCMVFVLQVLMEPKNALGKQYKKIFNMNNVSLHPFFPRD